MMPQHRVDSTVQPATLTVAQIREFIADLPDDVVISVDAPRDTDVAELSYEYEDDRDELHRSSIAIDLYDE